VIYQSVKFIPSRLLLSLRVPKSVIGITLGSESESEEEEIYSTSSIMMDVVPRMFKSVERGMELFKSTILRLRTLSLRSVMESLQAVRKDEIALKVSK
jgi:hypothetical protein